MSDRRSSRRRVQVLGGIAAMLPLAVLLPGLATPAAAATATLYAYASGAATPTGCPVESTPASGCSLATALLDSAAGDTVMLATAGSSAHYVGNWTVATTGTTTTTPLTITAASGLASKPVLDGNDGSSTGCSTSSCERPILTLGVGEDVSVTGVEFLDGDADSSPYVGGAILNGGDVAGGTLTVTNSVFEGNFAGDGGAAIANGDGSSGSGTLVVIDSTFLGNEADDYGGAISNGIYGGTGTLTVIGSTFADNLSTYYNSGGAAIANGDGSPDSTGTAVITDSTFTSNVATAGARGGAIDNGDENGAGVGSGSATMTVSNSTFEQNFAENGGAIDNGDRGGTGHLAVLGSTFNSDTASGSGAEILNGANVSATATTDSVVVAGDLFAGSCAQVAGTWTDDGRNAAVDSTCEHSGTGDVTSAATATQLASLTDNNGAATKTEALTASNPAIGIVPPGAAAVNAAGLAAALCPRTDQAGDKTPAGQACNAGAVDLAAPTRPTVKVSGGHKTVAKGAKVTFTGRARPGSTVTLYRGKTKLTSTTVGAAGAYAIARKVSGSASFVAADDHQVSSSLKITVVKLSLKVSGHKPYTTGRHTLSGKAPAGFTVTLLRDGKSVAHVKVGKKNTYSFTQSLSGTHSYRISADGVKSAALLVKT